MEPFPTSGGIRVDTEATRLEHMRPDQVAERWAQAPICYVPIGCIEFHGPHLPLGVDGLTAHAVCTHAAAAEGGVVHPVTYQANGCLDLPFTLTYPPSVVEAWARSIISQLHARGARLVVLLTGHGPLDLIHLLKRVCAEFDSPDGRAYGLCYLELNAARLIEPEMGEPTVIDHASTVETSWIMAHYPQLVDLSLLPDQPDAQIVGVYGKNPRFTATSEIGRSQREACADLLAQRCSAMLREEWHDEMDDLRRFVDLVWPEELQIEIVPAHQQGGGLKITNPGRASRYITSVAEVVVDGRSVDLAGAWIANTSVGEVGTPFEIENLHPEHGIYVRRGQSLDVVIPDWGAAVDPQSIEMTVDLAGVRKQRLTWSA